VNGFDEAVVILFTDAVIQDVVVVIKARDTSVTVSTVLGPSQNT